MKARLFICMVLATWGTSGYPQVLLNPGEEFIYRFDTLPLLGPSAGGLDRGLFRFGLDPATMELGDLLRYEMFEDTPSLPPLCSGTFDGPAVPSPVDWVCDVGGAWQDLQGTVRFTMVSGSAVLTRVTFGVVGTWPPGHYYEGTYAVVPEPSSWALLALALVAVLFPKWTRRRSCHAA